MFETIKIECSENDKYQELLWQQILSLTESLADQHIK